MEELVREVIDAVNRRDLDALEAAPLHPEFEFHSLFSVSEGVTLVGIEGLRGWAADVDAIWEDFQVEIEEVRMADPNTAVVCLRLTGRAKASGVPLDQRTGQIWTREGGVLRRTVGHPTPGDALRAAGLEP